MTGLATDGPAEVSAELPAYPMERAENCPLDPAPALRTLQAERPVARVRLWDGTTPWLVTRYAQQRILLADPRISADSSRPGFPHIGEGQYERRNRPRSFLTMDDPEHRRLRRMVTRPFTIQRIEAMRPTIQRIVDDLLDAMVSGPQPADLVEAFALPLPSLVICELLGVPYADHQFFQEKSSIVVCFADQSPETGMTAQLDLVSLLNRVASHKIAEPGDDLLSELAVNQVSTGELTEQDLAMVGALLLIAGHETTASMISLGTLALLEHPDQLAALRDTDDPALVANAVEELLRYLSIAHTGLRRVALEDIEIGGEIIRAGDGVILAVDMANWTESVFADPARLDLRREAPRHVAFGFGVHQCLGQPLARAELQIAYTSLFRRLPDLRLAVDVADVPFKRRGLFHGVSELPVTW